MCLLVAVGSTGACRCDDPLFAAGTGASSVSEDDAPRGLASFPSATPIQLEGSCANGRPMGPLSNYTHVIVGNARKAKHIRVRATPVWSLGDKSNVLGRVAVGTPMPAFGPLKGRPSAGIGYSVPLRDPRGATCRGYVSYTVVKPLAYDHYGGQPDAFPEPLDVTPGPCRVR